MFNISIELDIEQNFKKMINKHQMMQIGERLRDYHYRVMPSHDGSKESDFSISLVATILHDRCKLTMAGKPVAVKCSLYHMHWGERAHLRMHTS